MVRGCGIVFTDEAVDRGLKINDGMEDTMLHLRRLSLAKKSSKALSQEQDVGVKQKVRRG